MILILVLCLGSVSRAELTAEEYCEKKTNTYEAYQECIQEPSPTKKALTKFGNALKGISDERTKNLEDTKSTNCMPNGYGGLRCN